MANLFKEKLKDRVVVVMIESTAAIDNLPGLLSIEGVDVFFIGPNDLSDSMDLGGQMHHPKVKAAVADASRRIRAAGKIPGTLVARETEGEFVAAGCRFLYEHTNNLTVAGAHDFRRSLEGFAESARP